MNKLNSAGAMTVREIINGKQFIIPIYQRAYKWGKDDCERLAKDLCSSHKNEKKKSLGLITLKDNKNGTFDVIDGQQRFITLAIISKLLKIDELVDKITFQRDTTDGKERLNVLKNLSPQSLINVGFTDGDRMIRNAKEICNILNDNDLLWDSIENNCVMLCGIVSDNPLQEFMNLNAYKTPFSICDQIRSNLITLNTFHIEELRNNENTLSYALGGHSYKTAISKLYEEIITILYEANTQSGEYESVYDIVKKNCTDVSSTKESRINIIFNQLLNNNPNGYRCKPLTLNLDDWIKELIWLAYIKNLLLQLKNDIQNKDFYTSKLIDNYCGKDKTFFSLISKDIRNIENQTSNDLARILDNKNSIDNMIFGEFKPNDSKNPNLFLEALVSNNHNEEISKEYYSAKINKLNDTIITNDLQGAGKYIISRFLNEKQAEMDSDFKLSPILDFEDKENPKFKKATSQKDVWKTEELFVNNIRIPVIQRDYCMGSSIKPNGNEDFLSFILAAFSNNTEILASTIIVGISDNDEIYIFDGQQRTYTLYCLLKFLEDEDLKEYTFIGRDEINHNIDCPHSYIEESVKYLITAFKDSCKNIEKDKLKEFIKKKVSFNVKIVSEISSAEQFFMDINGGVALENYEIFKACLIENIGYSNNSCKMTFARKIENEWLKFFYNFTKLIYGEYPLDSEEELIEIRVLEFICRWLYNKNNPKQQKVNCFDTMQNKSDLVNGIEYLKQINASDICTIMDYLIKNMKTTMLEPDVVSFEKEEFKINSKGDVTCVGYSYIDNNINESFFLQRFIRSCSKRGRTYFFEDKHADAIKYYDADLILDRIVDVALGNSPQVVDIKAYKQLELKWRPKIKKSPPKCCSVKNYSGKVKCNFNMKHPIYLLGGYNNWSNDKITKHFTHLTEKELPIYYTDWFWEKEDNIKSYCNMYRTYHSEIKKNTGYAKKVNRSNGGVYLFLVMPPNHKKGKLILDKGKETIFNKDFKKIQLYSNGGAKGLYMEVDNSFQKFDLTKSSAYAIRLNQGEKSIVDKPNMYQ